ncbi:MAG: inorganic pyrophosphatase [Gemmatimonadetes bacterium]|jgi:inorganic pyrophosphatase|nr:inorganic pyrophosphatase [Gemmatimonadota bacterium]MBT4609888.1 inorganic pyrophosphatase [Gemmatimonadota bacterium]MBT5056948.1 inorganic pyrophosphatase [Gemmatimonadota bacterium]MBT5142201.1 inorganic pyrophosphatase [Gemmatimonadota bacterium]MBT5589214.1 inorganic pyrophosphatase [Gemmatimonadota bacterium]
MAHDGAGFWLNLDAFLLQGEVVIDRPKGAPHPRLRQIIYPLDYGYLTGTQAADGEGVDVWRGSMAEALFDAVVCTADPEKKDVEVKILLGCTAAEKMEILDFHPGGMLVERPPTAT